MDQFKKDHILPEIVRGEQQTKELEDCLVLPLFSLKISSFLLRFLRFLKLYELFFHARYSFLLDHATTTEVPKREK